MSDGLYFVGSVVRLSVDLADIDGAPVDPGGLSLKVRTPVGALLVRDYQAGEILRDGVGAFHADMTCDSAGAWAWRWESNAGAVEGVFRVQRSGVV